MHEEGAVCDTSPLLYLHQVDHLKLLPDLYGSVLIPPAVQAELRKGAELGVAVPDVESLPWLGVRPVPDVTLLPTIMDLGAGEAEAIALALFYPGTLLILDDDLGRRIARLNSLRFTGTLGVLIKAKQEGFVTGIAPILEKLQQTTMWLSNELIRMALNEAKEV
jgi:uncharacterized protein